MITLHTCSPKEISQKTDKIGVRDKGQRWDC